MKHNDVVNKLHSLREPLDQKEFLDTLSLRLKAYMALNPIQDVSAPAAIPTPYYTSVGFYRLVSVSLVVVLLLSGSGVAFASQQSLPGDTLYPVKIATEQLQERLTRDPVKKAALNVAFAKKRSEEIKQIVEKRGGEGWRIKIAEDSLEEHSTHARAIIDENQAGGVSEEVKHELVSQLDTVKQDTERYIQEDNQKDEERTGRQHKEPEDAQGERSAPVVASTTPTSIQGDAEPTKVEHDNTQESPVASDTVPSILEKEEHSQAPTVNTESRTSDTGDESSN